MQVCVMRPMCEKNYSSYENYSAEKCGIWLFSKYDFLFIRIIQEWFSLLQRAFCNCMLNLWRVHVCVLMLMYVYLQCQEWFTMEKRLAPSWGWTNILFLWPSFRKLMKAWTKLLTILSLLGRVSAPLRNHSHQKIWAEHEQTLQPDSCYKEHLRSADNSYICSTFLRLSNENDLALSLGSVFTWQKLTLVHSLT